MRIQIAAAARKDLKAIWSHVSAQASDFIADKLVRNIRASLDRLERYPLSGSPRDELAPGLRTVVHGSYLVLSVVEENKLVVTRVIHGAQDLDVLALQGRLR